MQNSPKDFHSSIHCSKAASFQGPSQEAAISSAINSLAFPINSSRDLIRNVQRLVHSHPDNAESWVLLSAALLSAMVLKRKDDSPPLVSLTNVALIKVDERLNSLKSNQSISSNKKLLAMYSNLYSWMMKSFVISNIYYGDNKTADSFCNRIIPTLSGDKAQEDFIFLKGLASLQELQLKREDYGMENVRVLSTLVRQSNDVWKWQLMAQIYARMLMPTSAEQCLRQLVKLNTKSNACNTAVLKKMCLLAVRVFDVTKDNDWLNRGLDAISELSKLNDGDLVITIIRAIIFHQQGNKKAAMKYVQKLTYVTDDVISELQEKLLELWKI